MAILENIAQTVTINSVEYRIGNCQVKRSFDQRIGNISFVVEADVVGDALYDAVTLDDWVIVTHSSFTKTIIDRGNITMIREVIINGARIKQVQARTEEARLQRKRFINSWEDDLAGDVVNDMITLYGTDIGITAGSINDHGLRISEIASRYDSFYDCMEQITAQTTLVWRVDNGQLSLFLPDDRTSPAIEAHSFITGSLAVEYKIDNVFNVARIQAWEYEDIEILGPACSTYQKLPLTGEGWELAGEITESPLFFPDNFKVNADALEATWDQPPYPFYARFKMRRLHWAIREDAASIALYGRREAPPLYHDGGTELSMAQGILAAYLARWSTPYFGASGIDMLNFGYDVDSVAIVDLPEYGIDQDVYITSVTRTYSRTELIVNIDIVSRSGIAVSIDPSRELMRRTERLERAASHPLAVLGYGV